MTDEISANLAAGKRVAEVGSGQRNGAKEVSAMLGEYDYPEGACACVDDNAQMCYEIRYDIDNDDNEEICDCACHAADNLDEHDGDEYYAGQFFGRR